VRLDDLFLDASHFKMHPGAPAEPVLAAFRIDVDGKPVFVGLAPASSESTDAWDDVLADLTHRGLGAPLLPISDGAPGLTGAFDRAFPDQPAPAVPGPPRPQYHWPRCRCTTRPR
jgi:putative transposase